MSCDLNVPLGALVISDVTNLRAPVGRDFSPAYYGDPAHPEPTQVFSTAADFNYHYIKENLQKQESYKYLPTALDFTNIIQN